jgi:hypothetical protein
MSTGKHHDQASHQLQLFGCEEPVEAVVKPNAFPHAEPDARPGLRLVASTAGVRLSAAPGPSEDLMAIAAKLVGRAKFF